MDHERWRRVEELFHAALEHGPEARRQFLDRVCNEDVDLRRQVELLLADEEKAGSFLDAPVVEDLTATLTAAASLMNRQLGAVSCSVAVGRRRHGRGLSRARRPART